MRPRGCKRARGSWSRVTSSSSADCVRDAQRLDLDPDSALTGRVEGAGYHHTLRSVGPWRSWERVCLAGRRSGVRIPSAPPNRPPDRAQSGRQSNDRETTHHHRRRRIFRPAVARYLHVGERFGDPHQRALERHLRAARTTRRDFNRFLFGHHYSKSDAAQKNFPQNFRALICFSNFNGVRSSRSGGREGFGSSNWCSSARADRRHFLCNRFVTLGAAPGGMR